MFLIINNLNPVNNTDNSNNVRIANNSVSNNRGVASGSEPKPILRLEGITKRFGKTTVLKGVTCDVPAGSYFGVIGPNGAGKSTLLKIIIGFLKPTSGRIYIEGKDASSRNIDVRHLFGYASQSNCFYQELTVEENLRYFGRLYWLTAPEIRKRTQELVTLVGLRGHEKMPAKHLSGGMQRKLDIACAIIHAPKILILDEPAAGLDPISARHLWKILDHIQKIGTTIIISSHILSDLENRCSKIILLNKGRIISQGSPKDLINVSHDKGVVIMTNPLYYDALINDVRQYDVRIDNHFVLDKRLVIITPEPEKTLYYLLFHMAKRGLRLEDINVKKPTLAEVFEQFVKKDIAMPAMNNKVLNQLRSDRKVVGK